MENTSFCFNGYYKTRIKLHSRRKTREEKAFRFHSLEKSTSARGYAQAVDGTWEMYLNDRGGWFVSRNDFEDSVDFVVGITIRHINN
ncbi:MAG: hypothetical protein CM15mP86_03340 [Gammaproteobacteria bacterium]|nr:MAG: hypothetical protein CM15mP86_03340 [Gammaproteobacteria bacterium]